MKYELFLLQTVFKVMPLDIYVTDAENSEFLFISGYGIENPNEYVGQESTLVNNPILQEACVKTHANMLIDENGNPNNHVEIYEYYNDSSSKWYQVHEKAIRWIDGRVAKYSAAIEITDLKRAQNSLCEAHAELALKSREIEHAYMELKDAQQKLVESQKMAALGHLVTGVSHEINTPVGVSITAASSLQNRIKDFKEGYEKGTLTKEQADQFVQQSVDACDMIMGNLDRTAGLINYFKNLSVDNSKETLQTLHLKTFFEDLVQIFSPKFEQKKHRLLIDCPYELAIETYPGELTQILSHLVNNSLSHGFHDRMNGTMKVKVVELNDQVEISYSDDGKGTLEPEVQKIFEPFYTTNRKVGIGLGLHIVYNIVTQKLQGSIEARSLDQGMEIRIQLPR